MANIGSASLAAREARETQDWKKYQQVCTAVFERALEISLRESPQSHKYHERLRRRIRDGHCPA